MSFLETKTMYLSREKNQSPTISISGDIFLKVKIRQAFPLSFEGKFITIFDSDDQYLGTMKKCGLKEIQLNGKKRIWRNVPSRSWQATHAKGKLSSSKEVLLLHKPNGKAVLN